MTAPTRSWVVWHTQRTGSTLLTTALESTGVAGIPDAWPDDIDEQADPIAQLSELRAARTTDNGVMGVKFGVYAPTIDTLFTRFGLPGESRRETFERIFPACQHIVSTRRDKIRLAVSWWKSISGGPGHLASNGEPLPWQDTVPASPDDLASRYDGRAIRNLVMECVQREAALQALLDELGVVPLTITYEDFVADYTATLERVMAYLELPVSTPVPQPLLAPTADEVNEVWVQRFAEDLQTLG